MAATRLQVRAQTDTKLFEPRDLVAEGPQGWIPDNLPQGRQAGLRPLAAHRQHGGMHLKAAAEKAGGTLVACDSNPIDAVWKDQPPPPVSPAVPHAFNLAGEKSEAKRARLGEDLKKAGADAAVITLADSVCWLLNIRGTTCRTRLSPWPSPSCMTTAAPTCSWTKPSAARN